MLGINRGRGFSRFMRLTSSLVSVLPPQGRTGGGGGEKEGASSSDLSQGLIR